MRGQLRRRGLLGSLIHECDAAWVCGPSAANGSVSGKIHRAVGLGIRREADSRLLGAASIAAAEKRLPEGGREMSESTAPAPKRGRRAAQQPAQAKAGESGEFECRRSELALLLTALDRELWKGGVTVAATPDDAASATNRIDDDEERRYVRDVTGIMFGELESRLTAFVGACAHLAEVERVSLAALLRLPEARRRAISAILRLPERERNVLRIAFALSEAECDALAQLLRPRPAPPGKRPSITIVDPSVREEEKGEAP